MNSSNLQTSGLDPAYNHRQRHHCLSAIHGCQPSTIEFLRLPLLVHRMLCQAMSNDCGYKLSSFPEDGVLFMQVCIGQTDRQAQADRVINRQTNG